MKKLAATCALLLFTTALAGGGQPPATVPLAAGQIWNLSYRINGEAAGQQTLTLRAERKDSPDSYGVRSFGFSDDPVESMAVWPGAKYLLVGLMNPHLVCTVPNLPGQQRGYLITGQDEAWEAVLPYRHGHSPKDSEIYTAAKRAGLGTCALKRVR